MSYLSLTEYLYWVGCSGIHCDFDNGNPWMQETTSDSICMSNYYQNALQLNQQLSASSYSTSTITALAQNPDRLVSANGLTGLYLEIDFAFRNMSNFDIHSSYDTATSTLTHETPCYTTPRYYLPIDGTPLMNNTPQTNIVTASFGMQYLINMQQAAWSNNIPLATYNNVDITEASFKKFLELTSRTRFEHNSGNTNQTIELIDDQFFIGLHSNPSKIPVKYSIGSAIMHKSFEEIFLSCLEKEPKQLYIDWVDSISSNGHLSTKTIPLPKNKVFYEEAYPCLNGQPLKEFIEDYLNSDSAVLLLYGPPGTGKTSLLKQIMQYANESCLITYNKDIAAMDTLFSHFYDCDERFLIIEDADTYISSRAKDGNDVMKKLLNVTDGLTARAEKKVIFTTNLNSLRDVDEALLREGRCYSTLHVDQLTQEQANHLLALMGHEPMELPKKISLANLYSLLSGRKIDQSTTQMVSGFGLSRGVS